VSPVYLKVGCVIHKFGGDTVAGEVTVEELAHYCGVVF